MIIPHTCQPKTCSVPSAPTTDARGGEDVTSKGRLVRSPLSVSVCCISIELSRGYRCRSDADIHTGEFDLFMSSASTAANSRGVFHADKQKKLVARPT